jgi:hypothetical protein
LDPLLDAITVQPIMIPATARPASDCNFGSAFTTTRLAPNQLGRDLIGAIMATPTVGKAAPKAIIAFGAARDYAGRPILNGTLHDALMARPNRHQPLWAVAQAAACIGREFGKWLLARASQQPEARLAAALECLIKAELIGRRGLPPEATCRVSRALVHGASQAPAERPASGGAHAHPDRAGNRRGRRTGTGHL